MPVLVKAVFIVAGSAAFGESPILITLLPGGMHEKSCAVSSVCVVGSRSIDPRQWCCDELGASQRPAGRVSDY